MADGQASPIVSAMPVAHSLSVQNAVFIFRALEIRLFIACKQAADHTSRISCRSVNGWPIPS